MKQYTTPEQTAKLIELGFEKPRYECLDKTLRGVEKWDNIQSNYSIGELLSLLPTSFENDNDDTSWLEIEAGAVWSVSYSSFGFIDYDCERKELIDALFDMVLQLEENGVI